MTCTSSIVRTLAAVAGLMLVAGCLEGGVDQIRDPQKKAEYHCRYVLERALASSGELSPDGVLRERIAEFANPRIQRNGDNVSFVWPAGAISRIGAAGGHSGECVMDIGDGQRLVSAKLDDRPLHAGFRF